MSTAKKTLYAAIGAGTTVIAKARELPQRVTAAGPFAPISLSEIRELTSKVQSFGTSLPSRAQKLVKESRKLPDIAADRTKDLLGELTKRGEQFYKQIQRSAPTRRAAEQNKSAKSRVKAATTSVKKAAEADLEAVKAAAEKATEVTA